MLQFGLRNRKNIREETKPDEGADHSPQNKKECDRMSLSRLVTGRGIIADNLRQLQITGSVLESESKPSYHSVRP